MGGGGIGIFISGREFRRSIEETGCNRHPRPPTAPPTPMAGPPPPAAGSAPTPTPPVPSPGGVRRGGMVE